MPIYGSSFGQGLQLGRSIFNDAESNRRANAADARAEAEAKRQQKDYDRQESVRMELANDPQTRSDYQALEDSAAVPATGYNPAMSAPAATAAPAAEPVAAGVSLASSTAPAPVPMAATGVEPMAAAPAKPTSAKIMPWVEKEDMAKEYARQAKILRNSGDVRSYGVLMEKSAAAKKDAAYTKFGHELVGMSDEDLAEKAKPWVSDNKDAPAMLRYDKKSKSYSVVHDSGEVQKFNPAQIRTLVLSAFEMGNGDVAAGVQKQLEVWEQNQKRTDTRSDKENAITRVIGDNDIQRDRLEMQENNANRRLAIAERGANNRAAMQDKPQLMMLADKRTGEPVPVWMRRDGTSTEVVLPEGLKFPKDKSGEATRKEITDGAKAMVESGAKNADGKAMNFEEAYTAVQDLFAGRSGGGGVEIDLSKLPALPPKQGVAARPANNAMQQQAGAAISGTPLGRFMAPNPNAEAEALAAKQGYNPYRQNRVGQ